MLCVYGIVADGHPEVVVPGVQGGATSLIREGDLAAIVSEVGGDLLARRRDVDAHLGVLERAFADGDVLPFRFGTVVADAEAMRTVIRKSAPRFRELLNRLRGRVQMTVKVVRDDDEAVRLAVGSDPNLRRVVARWRDSSEWSDRLALGERVAVAVDELSRQDGQVILTRLSALAEAVTQEPAAPPTVAAVSLLMQPERLQELDATVAALHDDFGHRLSFDYAGPMPAYSFVS